MNRWLNKLSVRTTQSASYPDCAAEVDGNLTVCAACGYDIVQQSRFDGRRPLGAPMG